MPQVPQPSVESSFIGGLKTEFTGLNFPENSWTQGDNVIPTIIGDITRREGFNFEANAISATIDRTNKAISTYKWNNAGGDGSTQVVVTQVGKLLHFYQSSNASILAPLSHTILSSTVDISVFIAAGSSADPSITECQFTDGNGYLFVFHPNLDPFYCTFASGVITANLITIQIRDFVGIPEPGVPDNQRPTILTDDHKYNLENQGWSAGSPWTATTNTPFACGSADAAGSVPLVLTSESSTSVTGGDQVSITGLDSGGFAFTMLGSVSSYSYPNITINVVSSSDTAPGGGAIASFIANFGPATIKKLSAGYITTWFSDIGNYPSNADVWWRFKDTSNIFNPTTTISNVTLNSGPAPKGAYILSAFSQQRDVISGISSLTDVVTNVRPKTGTWYQGRVWYAGVDSSFPPAGDQPFSTWTETIYFSQIVLTTSEFAKCYQTNDPTSEDLFALLPTDGGTIVIQGSGSIYKLFALKFGLLVFAANGIWFIGGSSGTGFAANDYTITKISNIQSTSGTSFVNVNGYPMFWNEEGVYYVAPSQQGGSAHSPDIALDVTNLALGTILSFYADIPLQSKKFARGDYHPLDYIVQWCYRDTNESSVTDRYQFNRILCFNTATKAFYTYTLGQPTSSGVYVHGINYVAGPGGSTSPDPVFKYLTSYTGSPYSFSFSEENSTTYTDWPAFGVGASFTSFFITGYNLKGKAMTKFQIPYVYMFSRNPAFNEYIIQSIWDYAGTGNSGRWSVRQVIQNNNPNFTTLYKKHRLRGRGLAVQIQITSMPGQPFDLMGWSMWNEVQQGI